LNQVQIEILLLNSIAQRVSILKVHTTHMFAAGRLQVNDSPPGSPAARLLLSEDKEGEENSSILTTQYDDADDESKISIEDKLCYVMLCCVCTIFFRYHTLRYIPVHSIIMLCDW